MSPAVAGGPRTELVYFDDSADAAEVTMSGFQLAQVNVARMRTPFDDPAMAGFVAKLAEVNALADRSEGFVWRLKSDEGDATYLRPYDDDRILFNLSIWRDVQSLRHFVYRTMHVEVLKQRESWFEKFGGSYLALWWVPTNHIPSVEEAKKRLTHLDAHGPTPFAFTFGKAFPPDEQLIAATDWRAFEPCTSA